MAMMKMVYLKLGLGENSNRSLRKTGKSFEGIEGATGLVAGVIIDYLSAQVDFPEVDVRQRLTVSRGYGVTELYIPEGLQESYNSWTSSRSDHAAGREPSNSRTGARRSCRVCG